MEAHSANILRKSGRSASRRGGDMFGPRGIPAGGYVRVAGYPGGGGICSGRGAGGGWMPVVGCRARERGGPLGPRFSSVRKTLRAAFQLCPENPPGRRFGSVRKTPPGRVSALSGKPSGPRFSSVRNTLRAAFRLCPENPPGGVSALSGKPSGPRFGSVRKTLRAAFWLCPENPCGSRFGSVRKTLRAAFWLCPENPPEGGPILRFRTLFVLFRSFPPHRNRRRVKIRRLAARET